MREGKTLQQAFPEEAHEIGMQLAKEILGGKYEFVLTTHIDKGHIHNHLIFNAVSFTDHKHYHSTSAAITKYAGPATGCVKNMACPLLFQDGTKVKATLSIRPHRTVPATRQS